MNILHLVLGVANSHYSPIEEVAKDTWAKYEPDNIKTIFMYGGSDRIYWDNERSFYVNRPENLNICLYKTILAFETFLESNFDYIFRSVNTGYFDYKLITEFVEDKPLEKFYCGCIGHVDGIDFASGSGYFLSKDLVYEIVKNKDLLLSYGIPNGCDAGCDDVLIGKFITKVLNIEINTSAKRLDILPKDISDDLDMSHYHYRILFERASPKYISNNLNMSQYKDKPLFKENCDALYKIHELKNIK